MKTLSALSASLLLLTACSAERKELNRQLSPNRKLVAVLMESLGGDAGASLREEIYVNDQSLPLSLDKPVFSAVGCDRVSLKWLNDYTLEIRYETVCAISHFTNRWNRPSDTAVGRENPIEVVLVRS
jgi:hypothetical protein